MLFQKPNKINCPLRSIIHHIQPTNNSGYPILRLETLGRLANLGLLGVRPGRASDNALPADELGEANLGVDLLHALEVGLGCAFGAKDKVLCIYPLAFWCLCGERG